jgi:hypothetical protein
MHARRRRKWWQIFSRPRCTCGLPWPCIESWMAKGREGEELRTLTALSDPGKSADSRRPEVPSWQTNTMPLFQVARAGSLTPGQERRSRGGAPC